LHGEQLLYRYFSLANIACSNHANVQLFRPCSDDGYDLNENTIVHTPSSDFVKINATESATVTSRTPLVVTASLPSLNDAPFASHLMFSDGPTLSFDHAELPPLHEHGAAIGDFRQWDRWSSAERMVGLSHWFLYADNQYGSLDRWVVQFMADWAVKRSVGPEVIDEFLERVGTMIQAGYHAMTYLGRLMEGTMPVFLTGDLLLRM
jgi:hypothetical protein